MMADNSTTFKQLKEQVKSFPCHPGVYLMRDEDGEVIYIGKAKSLRDRVKSYFSGGDGRYQIEFLVKKVRQLDKILTSTEEEALILERDLINKHKPRYNIRLKDDKSYISIRIDQNQDWPRLQLVRRVEQDGARYFGPYTFSYEVREVLDIINRVVPLRSCADTVLYNRQRPCLQYQIKRCLGPCSLEVDREVYNGLVKQAMAILEGKTGPLIKAFEERMKAASNDLCFEEAALFRDRIEVLKNFRKGQAHTSSDTEDRDVFALYREERLAALSVINVRYGRISNNTNFHFNNVEIPDEEVLEAAVEQYYRSGREIPAEIILPAELVNAALLRNVLKEKRGAALQFVVPRRGVKFRLLGLALVNAKEHYASCFDAENRHLEVSKSLARMLKLPQIPRMIECVDISNFQGSDIVGALVVFYDGVPEKNSYKRYTISFQDKPDDFAAVAEVVRRRLSRGMEEDDLPDLMIIDGGPGQLQAALEVRDDLRLSTDIIALAKERQAGSSGRQLEMKPERLFVEGVKSPIKLKPASEVTHYLARIRDEAHRFVISFHRRKRSKRVFHSVLDEVPGIGAERKKRLIKKYGSVSKMKDLAPEELAQTGRMPLIIAERLLERLKKQ